MTGKAALVCFTRNGIETALRCREALAAHGIECRVVCKKKGYESVGAVPALEGSLKDWTSQRFLDCELIIFVGAAGIAVRSIAPFIVSKREDPAVLCIDEQGKYVISLLSGHIGRGNEFADMLARSIGALAIITTATDLNDKFAVDVFARKNDLWISDMTLAKEASAQLLDGKKLAFFSEWETDGERPEELIEGGDEALRIYVAGRDTFCADDARPNTLTLLARSVTLGVGCRKGKDPGVLEEFLLKELSGAHIDIHSIYQVASIDLKAKEEAITQFAAKYALPYRTFTGEELLACPGEFTASAFVRGVTGVDNVCERSAVLGSGGGRLILKKTAKDGCTVAAAVQYRRIQF